MKILSEIPNYCVCGKEIEFFAAHDNRHYPDNGEIAVFIFWQCSAKYLFLFDNPCDYGVIGKGISLGWHSRNSIKKVMKICRGTAEKVLKSEKESGQVYSDENFKKIIQNTIDSQTPEGSKKGHP